MAEPDFYRTFPEKHRRIKRLVKQQREPNEVAPRALAIRLHCAECMGYQIKDIADCRGEKCWLYPYRMGTSPPGLRKSPTRKQIDALTAGRKTQRFLQRETSGQYKHLTDTNKREMAREKPVKNEDSEQSIPVGVCADPGDGDTS